MANDKSVPARKLVKGFLLSQFGVDGDRIGLCYYNGRFYSWAGGCYTEISDEEVKTKFTAWATEKKVKNFNNTRGAAEEALHHIKSRLLLPNSIKQNSFIDGRSEARHFAFDNGIVDISDALKKGTYKPIAHTPNFFNLAKIPYSFRLNAKCPTWTKLVNDILPEAEDRRLLQQWFGFHLLPGLSRAKMMFFEGQGANGKSVVLLVLRLVLGEENVSSIPLSAFDPDKTFKLASTEGKLSNICEEAGQVSTRVEEALKQYVNGGVFTVERKFKDPFQMYPSAKLTIATNDIPQFKDKSSGIWRRILYIKFNITIEAQKQRREFLERDYWLKSGELPGVLSWALAGALDLESNSGFISSDRKEEELLSLKLNSDLLRTWVIDHFKERKGYNQPVNNILKEMKQDSDDGLLPRISPRELYREIAAQFPDSKRPLNAVLLHGKRARVICGVQLVNTRMTQSETD